MGLSTGSAAELGRGGIFSHLVYKGLVVINVQYRLGAFGWLEGVSNSTATQYSQRGLHDANMAVDFIRKHVRKFFRGDPNRITIGGQGQGACIAGQLGVMEMGQPEGKKRFQRVLLMGGSPTSCLAQSVFKRNRYSGSSRDFLDTNCPQIRRKEYTEEPEGRDDIYNCVWGQYRERPGELGGLVRSGAISYDRWDMALPEYNETATARELITPSFDNIYTAAMNDSSLVKSKLQWFMGVGIDAWSMQDEHLGAYDMQKGNTYAFHPISLLNPEDPDYRGYMQEMVEYFYGDKLIAGGVF